MIIDDSPIKQNRFSPGKHIKIINKKSINLNNIDIVIVFAYEYFNEIKTNFKNNNVIFYKPIPFKKIKWYLALLLDKNQNKVQIGLIGNGQWAKIVKNEIKKNKKYNLKAIITKKDFIPLSDCKIKKITDFKTLIKSEKFDCFYVASKPSVNMEIFTIIEEYKIPIIFEKPIFDKKNDCNRLYDYLNKNNHCIFTNLPNIYSQVFQPLNINFLKYKNNIKKIYLFEGKDGNRNKNIHPLLDWGIHSLSLILKLFNNENFDSINYTIIKSNIDSFISKIILNYQGINIKILSGNGFKKKTRILKIILNNNKIIKCDFNTHILYIDNKVISQNSKSPLTSLLDKFYENIKYGYKENEKENILISLKSINILCEYL